MEETLSLLLNSNFILSMVPSPLIFLKFIMLLRPSAKQNTLLNSDSNLLSVSPNIHSVLFKTVTWVQHMTQTIRRWVIIDMQQEQGQPEVVLGSRSSQ